VRCISWSTGGHRQSRYAVGSIGYTRSIAGSLEAAIWTGRSTK
jgi:hypothetical protein